MQNKKVRWLRNTSSIWNLVFAKKVLNQVQNNVFISSRCFCVTLRWISIATFWPKRKKVFFHIGTFLAYHTFLKNKDGKKWNSKSQIFKRWQKNPVANDCSLNVLFFEISYIIYFHIGTEIFEFKLYQFSNIWLNLFSLFAKVRPLFESSQTTTRMLLVHLKRVQSWVGLNGATNSKLQFQLFTKGQPVWSNNKKIAKTMFAISCKIPCEEGGPLCSFDCGLMSC